jgi:hypothetical protein
MERQMRQNSSNLFAWFRNVIRMVATTSSTVFDNRGLSFFNRIDRFLHS